eukprot:10986688-Karenia_brevis.AAC.1
MVLTMMPKNTTLTGPLRISMGLVAKTAPYRIADLGGIKLCDITPSMSIGTCERSVVDSTARECCHSFRGRESASQATQGITASQYSMS